MESKLTLLDEHAYLQPLTMLAKPPESLYIQGTIPHTRQLSVAIVGTRRPSSYGKEVTYRIAHDLARQGIIIISGLAYGVDAIAHTAALDAGGITIAVLPTSLDSLYPVGHSGLAKKVASSGALISEQPRGSGLQKYHFLIRNRLISGLADAVIVTEAAAKSGTASTVGHALDQNKDIFAIPGNITQPLSVGPNRLIQQGAYPILSVQDILDVIAPAHATTSRIAEPPSLSKEEGVIVALLQSGIKNEHELQQRSQLETSLFLQTLTMLEIEGIIRRLAVGEWVMGDNAHV